MQWDTELISLALENLWDGVCVFDIHNTIRYWNHAATELSGYEHEDVLDREVWTNIFLEAVAARDLPILHAMMRHKDGHSIPVSIRVIPATDRSDNTHVSILVFNMKDVRLATADRKLHESCDTPFVCARREGEIQLYTKLDEMRRYGTGFGLMIVQIKTAQHVLASTQSTLTDETLRDIGHRITKFIRASDLVCQWDTEKLLVIMLYLTQSGLRIVADRIQSAIEQSDWLSSELGVPLTISIGATLSNPNDNLQSLTERAEQLVRKAANEGGNAIKMDEESK
jgi:diguanylate cyclase (GGDEF)-like protein/PAS domain S-box-containing protein